MPLQAKELRIGNYISGFGEPQKVTLDVLIHFDGLQKTPLRMTALEITADLLKSAGFTAWDNGEDCGHIKDGVKLEYMTFFEEAFDGWYFIADGMTDHVKIAHFHQLQNLYFVLTGKELELRTKQVLNDKT